MPENRVVEQDAAAGEPLRLARLETALRHDVAALRRLAAGLGAAEIDGDLATLAERLDERTLGVLVLGEFNRGKSTLINSILGAPWLPSGVTPSTRLVSEVRYGPEERIELHYRDGVCQRVDRESFPALVAADPAENGPTRAVLHLPLPILRHLTFVDTPGLNDPDALQTELVYDLLPRCDVALFVLDASFALGLSERTIIGEKLLQSSLGRLVFVLSRADQLDGPDDEAAVVQRVSTLLEPLLGAPPLVLPYAARDALRGEHGGRNAALRRLLLEDLPQQKLSLLLAVGRARAATAAAQLERALKFRHANLHRSVAELDEELAAASAREGERHAQVTAALDGLSTRLAGARDAYVVTLHQLANTLSRTLPDEIRAVDADDVRRYLPFYIQDTFRWHVEESLPHLRDAVAAACAAAAQDVQGAMPVEEALGTPDAAAFPLGGRLAPDLWDQGLVASVFAGSLGIFLNPLLAATLLVGGPAMRVLTMKQRRAAAQSALLAEAERAVFATADAMATAVAAALAAFEDGLRERTMSALDREAASARAALESLRTRCSEGAGTQEAEEHRIAADRAALSAIRLRLEGDEE